MTLNLGSVLTQIIIQEPTPLDVSQAFVSLTISGNVLDESGWYKPRGQIVLGVLPGFAESFDCRVNPGRWAPGNEVSVSVWLGGVWVPLPWRLRILAYPNRPMPGNQNITLQVGTDADLLNYRAPEGDPGTDEYGTPASAVTLINRALTQAGAPSLVTGTTISTLTLPFSPEKNTSGSWITYAGGVAYAARHVLWQRTNGDIVSTPITLDGLTPVADIEVGVEEADYMLEAPGEQPPEEVQVQGTTYDIEDAIPEGTDVTEDINGVLTRTRVEYEDWLTDEPKIIETVYIPLELMKPPVFAGISALFPFRRTTNTKYYDEWSRLYQETTLVEVPLFTLPFNLPQNTGLRSASEETIIYEWPVVASGGISTEVLQRIKTSQVISRRRTSRRIAGIVSGTLTLINQQSTVEDWKEVTPENYLYRTNTRDTSDEGNLQPPAQPSPPQFQTPPQTQFKPAEKQRTEKSAKGKATFTNEVESSYADKKWVLQLPSGMGISDDQCRAHATLWGKVRQGRQFQIKWSADLTSAWLTSFSPIRRVDFSLNGITTAYLVEAFNIAIDQRSAAVGGLGLEIGQVDGETIDPPYRLIPEAYHAVAVGGLVMAAVVELEVDATHAANVGALTFAAEVGTPPNEATYAANVGGVVMAANADPVLDATYAANIGGLVMAADVNDNNVVLHAASVGAVTMAATGEPVVSATHAANVGGVVMAASVELVATITPEILWLEADYGVTESGGAVSAWADRSANAYSFTQGTAGSRPTLTASVLNGHPVLRFDGGDWLSMSTTLLNTSGATADLYAVVDHRGGTAGAIIHTRTGVDGFSFRLSNATTLLYYHTGSTPNLSRTIVDQWNLLEIDRDGLSVALGDGGTLGSPTTISGFTAATGGTLIGGGGNEVNLTGDIAAIIIATSNRAGILSYLQDKYGV